MMEDFLEDTKTENKISVSDFLNNEVVNFASYSTLRAIASLVDGLKNSHRKVIHYMQSNGSKEKKLFNLAGEIMTSTEYLHGDISGSVVALAQNYTGSNNLALLSREGNFGTRFTPSASAARYIYTMNEKHFDSIFNKDDNNVLISQEFEGTSIEPRFFVPTIPLILLNGSEGIATGFAQKILPRKLKLLKEAIISKITDNKDTDLIPGFNGFNGTIEKGGNKNQFLIKGSYKISDKYKNTIIITEIPIGYTLSSYTKILDTLEEKKTIRTYKDLSEDDIFKFEIKVTDNFINLSNDDILDKLKLIKKVTENFTVIDENNKIVVYNSASEILNHYIRVKLEYLEKRKDFLIKNTEKELDLLNSKYNFIKAIIDGKLILNNRKKKDIIEDLDRLNSLDISIIKKDNSYDYLLKMALYNLTEETLLKLISSIEELKLKLNGIINQSIKDTWIKELNEINDN